jgi:hypothetical protein
MVSSWIFCQGSSGLVLSDACRMKVILFSSLTRWFGWNSMVDAVGSVV